MKTELLRLLVAVFIASVLGGCTSRKTDYLARTSLLRPLDQDSRASTLPTLEWQGKVSSRPQDVTFDLYVDTNSDPRVLRASRLRDTRYVFTQNLEPNTTYYWKVLSRLSGEAEESEVFSFTTGPLLNVNVESVNITGATVLGDRKYLTLNKNSSSVLQLEILPDNASSKKVYWSSNDENVAKVEPDPNNDGRATIQGIGGGSCVISVKSVSNPLATDVVTVNVIDSNVVITGLTITVKPATPKYRNNPNYVSLQVGVLRALDGPTGDLTVAVTPGTVLQSAYSIDWTSGDTSKAEVVTGRVRGINPGTVEIIGRVRGTSFFQRITYQITRRVPEVVNLFNNGSVTNTQNNHKYYVFRSPKSWSGADADAKRYGGYLVSIDDAAEQAFISNLIDGVRSTTSNSGNLNLKTSKTDGDTGEILYFWIGARKVPRSTSWAWYKENTQNATVFGSGDANNWNASGFDNWGKSTNSNRTQPNNDGGNQTAAGLAFDTWSDNASGNVQQGQKYQWNDLRDDLLLPFIIEVDGD